MPPAYVSRIQLLIYTAYLGLISFFSRMLHNKVSTQWASDIFRDHFDQKVEASLRRDLPIVTTPQVKTRLISKDQGSFTSVFALRPFEHVDIHIESTDGPKQPRLRVTGMPGKNVTSKRLLHALAHAIPPTNGWMLELGYGTPDTSDFTCSYRIYISGNTFATKKLQEVARRYEGQPINLMLANLGGTTIPSFLAGRIMEPLASTVDIDAEDCLKIIQLIKPDLTIPIHDVDFDVFRSSLEAFQRMVEAAGLSDKVLVLDRGDEYRFHVRG
ncbi:hypothetical protein N7467_002605 [Penicillium canescens]|nr:hypothetical protein N7467_002605 [Penicillium canescens]